MKKKILLIVNTILDLLGCRRKYKYEVFSNFCNRYDRFGAPLPLSDHGYSRIFVNEPAGQVTLGVKWSEDDIKEHNFIIIEYSKRLSPFVYICKDTVDNKLYELTICMNGEEVQFKGYSAYKAKLVDLTDGNIFVFEDL